MKMREIIMSGIFTIIGAMIGALISREGIAVLNQLMDFLGIEFIIPLIGSFICILTIYGTSHRQRDLDPVRDTQAHDEYNRKRSSVWLLYKWISRKLRGKKTWQMEREIKQRSWIFVVASFVLFLIGLIMIGFWLLRLVLS